MFARVLLGISIVSIATPALAGEGDDLRGFIEFGVAVADGEDSWLERGFGKTRFSGEEHVEGIARGIVLWRPQLPWNLQGHLTAQADSQLDPVIDVVEAYVTWRGAPSPGWRFGARAGGFFPPSLEHDGPAWTTTNTLTPSAINSWIGEEVKVVGAEANARRRFGDQEFTARLALFGFNDTSGTLLAFRGWALNDLMAGINSEMPLPAAAYLSKRHQAT